MKPEPAVVLLAWMVEAADATTLLVLDGGGKGKDPSVDSPLDPAAGWLAIGRIIVLDDFTPAGVVGAAEHDAARRVGSVAGFADAGGVLGVVERDLDGPACGVTFHDSGDRGSVTTRARIGRAPNTPRHRHRWR